MQAKSKTWAPEKIKELREKLGMTQTSFAAALNTSAMSVSRWELGKATPDVRAQDALDQLQTQETGVKSFKYIGPNNTQVDGLMTAITFGTVVETGFTNPMVFDVNHLLSLFGANINQRNKERWPDLLHKVASSNHRAFKSIAGQEVLLQENLFETCFLDLEKETISCFVTESFQNEARFATGHLGDKLAMFKCSHQISTDGGNKTCHKQAVYRDEKGDCFCKDHAPKA